MTNIFLENVNLSSRSGPNSFASKLIKYLSNFGHNFVSIQHADARLCFIESFYKKNNIPLFQRLDGIYFNTKQDFEKQNQNIKRTYENSDGVIFQSEFNKRLTHKYFGPHDNSRIIHNGADMEFIEKIQAFSHPRLNRFNKIWSCASHWRPHKRLDDNIRYFLEHADQNDCLVVAGKVEKQLKNDRIFYVGEITYEQILSLYKASSHFIHLAWLDHCPNVVVDARACGCNIICSSAGGTREIAGLDATIIEEEEWDLSPVDLYSPPPLDFNKKVKNFYDSCYNMEQVAKKYSNFIKGINEHGSRNTYKDQQPEVTR
tara:strand:- start:2467 stop:3414 length:948 start_codon:yes stop_codon:yes gene_type:complete